MRQRRQNGYTILEVLIFLMITGFMFATAVAAISGSQEETQYSQAVRDFETQVKDSINDVANGYYPTIERGRCFVTGSGNINFNNSVNVSPAQNVECVNIGKIMMFNLPDNENTFGLGTIVGKNPKIDDDLDLDLSTLNPVLAYKTGGTNPLDLTTYKALRFGARVTKIGSESHASTTYSSLSFISGFSNTTVTDDTRSSGTLNTNVYGLIGGLTSSSSLNDYGGDVENLSNPSAYHVNPPRGFYVCLLTNNDRRARIVIGVDGVATATKTEYDLDSGPICP